MDGTVVISQQDAWARFQWRGLQLELFDIKEKRREIVLDLKRISLWNCSND